jgi:hypothetical protein
MKRTKQKSSPMHFPAIPLAEVVDTRAGKHSKIVGEILSDLTQLDQYSALKVDFIQAGKKRADLRSALHRAANKKHIELVTTSDEKHLYVFRRAAKTQSGR